VPPLWLIWCCHRPLPPPSTSSGVSSSPQPHLLPNTHAAIAVAALAITRCGDCARFHLVNILLYCQINSQKEHSNCPCMKDAFCHWQYYSEYLAWTMDMDNDMCSCVALHSIDHSLTSYFCKWHCSHTLPLSQSHRTTNTFWILDMFT
jgi:hypothetical protein